MSKVDAEGRRRENKMREEKNSKETRRDEKGRDQKRNEKDEKWNWRLQEKKGRKKSK
jgi:hypothetical protein